MIVRYIPADPAGNLTAIVLSPVAPQARAAVAARMMARCPEGFEQVGFAEEDSLTGEFPRLCMMGGEFCGNAARAFACYAAGVRGRGETRLSVAISGARNPVPVEIEPASGRAYAQMPLPCALDRLCADGRDIPLVRMEGIDHALLLNEAPSPELAERVLAVMPGQDAQGVLFVQGGRMTPLVYVPATDTRVWESSCGSRSRWRGIWRGALRTARASSPSTNPAVGWRPASPWRAGAPRASKWAGRSGWAKRGKY